MEKMFLKNVFVIVIVTFIVQKSLAARPRVPCPDIFRYARSKGENVGIVTVHDVDYGDTVLDIKLSQAEDIDSDYYGKISLNFDINKSSEYIETGTPFVYKVRFALEDVIPKLQEIKLNGVQICSRGKKIPADHTTVDLQHTLTVSAPVRRKNVKKPKLTTTTEPIRWPITTKTTPLRTTTTASTTTTPISNPQNNLPRFLGNTINNPQFSTGNFDGLVFGTVPPGPVRTFTTTTTTTPRPRLPINFNFFTSTNPPAQTTTISPQPTSNNRFNFIQKPNEQEWRDMDRVCGLENSVDVNELVVNGSAVPKARFPWIVAIFLKNGGSPSFQCGGSLITTRTVISAAHCFHLLDTQSLIGEENVLVSMGRHFLEESFESDGGVVNRDVEKIIRHPDYKLEFDINDADVAIVQLKDRVDFTIFIRPVCMWGDVLDVSAIQGLSGIIVGWGRDEHGNRLTKTPRLASAKVVSESDCLRSNDRFSRLTSRRTLCAGNRDGTGPCKGDSGSGLMMLIKNKWRLRGTVSRSLSSKDEICDLNHYVLYTDIAQFLGWIFFNSVF